MDEKIGDYILLELLGEGGMAYVYNAFHPPTERNVAIKIISKSLRRSASTYQDNFIRESKFLASLNHNHIVKVLDFGIHDGNQPYLVMEYMPGGSLKDMLRRKIHWQTAAKTLAPVAWALEYVHRQGIVHLDVKPSNILLQEDFQPMLADFGIFKVLKYEAEKADLIISAGVGTPTYMSPEQATEEGIDFTADIYSLGLVFYEMITGQKPFEASSRNAVIMKQIFEKLPLPSHIDNNIPNFVERAIVRATQKNPRNRYSDMGQFAEVLELLARESNISRGEIIKLTRQKRQPLSRRSVFGWSIGLLSSIVIASLLIYNLIISGGYVPFERPFFSTPSKPPTVALNPTSQLTPSAIPSSTNFPMWTITPTFAEVEIPSSPVMPVIQFSTGGTSNEFAELARWGIGGISIVEWSPDGQLVALATTTGVYIYSPDNWQMKRYINPGFIVKALAFHPNSPEIVVGGSNGQIQVWNYVAENSVQEISYLEPSRGSKMTGINDVTAISFSPLTFQMAVGFGNGVINVFPTNQYLATISLAGDYSITDIEFSYDERFIYATGQTPVVDIWNLQQEQREKNGFVNLAEVSKLSISPDGRFLLAGGMSNAVYMWDCQTRVLLTSFPNLGGQAVAFDVSSNNSLVGIALNNGQIQVFEVPLENYSQILTPIETIQANDTEILDLKFAPNQSYFATVSHQNGLNLWAATNGEILFSLGLSMQSINEIQLSTDGRWLVTAHTNDVVRLWNVSEAKLAFETEGSLPKGFPFSPDNNYLVYVLPPMNNGFYLEIIDLNTLTPIARLSGYMPGDIVQFRGDSQMLVSGSPTKANLWDVATWEKLLVRGGARVCGRFVTPNNSPELLALVFKAGILFEDSKDVSEMCGLNPPGAIFKFFFKSQNKMLFVLENGDLWIGNSKSTNLSSISSLESYPTSDQIFLAGHQDSGWYAYVKGDILTIRNINNSSAGTTIRSQSDYLYRVAFAPNSGIMALGSRYGSIHIWSMPSQR